MPLEGPGGGGGGSGFSLGPVQNEFATDAARNTYATANAAWLALYNADRSFWIQVGGVAGAIQRRNAAGDDWETVTGLIRGPTGGPGAAGGGALEQYPTFARTSISTSEDDIWLDLGFDWDQSVEHMAFTRTGGNAFYWFRAAEIYGSPDSVDPGVIGAGPTAAQRYTVNDAGIGGAVNLGINAAGRALIEFTSSQASAVSIIILKYISSAAQGGLSAAQAAELTRLGGVETDATQDQTGAEIKASYEAESNTNAYTDTEKTKLGGVAAGANLLIPYKIGNIYRAFATGAFVIKPGNTEGVVTESGISEAPVGWQLTRPEATEALPHVYDCHVYGYATNGVFSWQFGTPNRTDRYIAPGGGGGGSPDTAAQVLAKLLTVDGVGSGLDAELLAGMTLAQLIAMVIAQVGVFDLHDDVTAAQTGNLSASDRFAFSNENVAGAPTEYTTLSQMQAAILSINYLTISLGLATVDRANELIQSALTAAVTGNTETNITVIHNADGTLDFAVIYPNQVTQAEAEAGTGNIARLWTPQRVAQAIEALAPGGQTTGLNQTQVDARVQAGLMAAVMDNTETGITVTYNADGTLDFVTSGGGTPPTQTHLNYVGVRAADTSVVAADLTVSGMTAALTLPAYTGAAHLIYSYPTGEGPPSAIYLYQDGHRNVQNQSSIFGITGTVMLGGEEHTWRATDDAQTGFGGYILEQAR